MGNKFLGVEKILLITELQIFLPSEKYDMKPDLCQQMKKNINFVIRSLISDLHIFFLVFCLSFFQYLSFSFYRVFTLFFFFVFYELAFPIDFRKQSDISRVL